MSSRASRSGKVINLKVARSNAEVVSKRFSNRQAAYHRLRLFGGGQMRVRAGECVGEKCAYINFVKETFRLGVG